MVTQYGIEVWSRSTVSQYSLELRSRNTVMQYSHAVQSRSMVPQYGPALRYHKYGNTRCFVTALSRSVIKQYGNTV
eukprot:scaffold334892_cov139-Cyclotella_meneghiniana.AAC.1